MASSERLHAEVEIESLFQERRGPGLSLRQAREHCRLTVASVAETLHLEQRVIEALEADDYTPLPPVTYVRGYLCAYARLVNLPVADVLQAFERVGLEEHSRPLTSKVGSRAGRRRMTRLPSGSSWLLTAAFGAVLVSGWMFWVEGQATPEATSGSEAEVEAAVNAPAAVSDAGTVRMPADGLSAVDAPAAGSAPDGLSIAAGMGVERPVLGSETLGIAAQAPATRPASGARRAATPATAGNADAALGQVPPRDPAIGAAANDIAAAQVSGGPAITADAELPALAGALETLEVEATGKSWVEVQDAGGQRLIYALLERGDSRRVTGRPPFDVTIGDVTQVTLHYDGARVDLGPYTHGNVARFTLSGADDKPPKASSD